MIAKEGIKMREDRIFTRIPLFLLTLLLSFSLCSLKAAAEESSTDYEMYLGDFEDLLTDEEEDKLLEKMEGITKYGGVAFITDSSDNAEQTAADYCYELFNNDSGIVFLIDMGERRIAIMSSGAIYKRVTNNYATLITDNIYNYAKNEDYLGCAMEGFSQILTLLEGGRIAAPMKHITNLLIALVLGLVLNFIYLWVAKKRVSAPEAEYMTAIAAGAVVGMASKDLISSHKTRHSSDSGSGGGFSGGGGGGGFSGGGGSHGF